MSFKKIKFLDGSMGEKFTAPVIAQGQRGTCHCKTLHYVEYGLMPTLGYIHVGRSR